MFYHASQVRGIENLVPHISNHGKSLVYLSTKKENTLVYISNAIEKYCKSIGYIHKGVYHKWASYGFNKDGILVLNEYYPNATEDTYKGIEGYIYSAENIDEYMEQRDIPQAITTESPVHVTGCEYIPDAYEAILKAHNHGQIILQPYEDNSHKMMQWIEDTIKKEFQDCNGKEDYRKFLKGKFEFLSE